MQCLSDTLWSAGRSGQAPDEDVYLENWAEMIELDDEGNFKQVRFSPRLDFVPLMDKDKLELYFLEV